MGFNTDELNKPLDPRVVATRSMSGRTLSYVEAWYVIDRLNQVFGFDGWHRETMVMNLVQQEERENDKGRKLQYVGYVAKVKILVRGDDGWTMREGTGFGQGQDADLGRAHESAVKEAESDAMKRAAMTFGYQFGLALYDKTQEHVAKPSVTRKTSESPSTGVQDDHTAIAARHLKLVYPDVSKNQYADKRREAWKDALAKCGNPEDACATILAMPLEGKALRDALEVVDGGVE